MWTMALSTSRQHPFSPVPPLLTFLQETTNQLFVERIDVGKQNWNHIDDYWQHDIRLKINYTLVSDNAYESGLNGNVILTD